MTSQTFRDYLQLQLRAPLYFLTIIGVFVGFIAVVNFAGLVLARGIRRRAELGVRAALGASHRQLAAHVIGECMTLCAIGGILAALGAPLVIHVLRVTFVRLVPDWLVVDIRPETLALGVASTILLGGLFAIGPALDVSRPALASFLRATGSTISGTAGLARTRSAVVAVQVALSSGALVTLGALMSHGVYRATPNVGFSYENLLMGYLSPGRDKRSNDRWQALLAEIRGLPQVSSASVSQRLYLDRRYLSVDAQSGVAGGYVEWLRVSDGFFAAMRPRLLAGRFPTAEEERTAAGVAVVTQSFAAEFGGSILGRQLRVDKASGGRAPDPVTIIGIVENVGITGPVNDRTAPTVVGPLPHAPLDASVSNLLWMRTPVRPATAAVRTINRGIGGSRTGLEVEEIAPFSQMLWRQITAMRAFARLAFGIFAIALALAGLGIYGLVSYTVDMRARELAIHEALGASRPRVSLLVLGSAAIEVALGTAAGSLLGTYLSVRLSEGFREIMWPAVGTTALAIGLIALAVFVASSGPLFRVWNRDLVLTLKE